MLAIVLALTCALRLQEADRVVATIPEGVRVLDSAWSSDGTEVAYCAEKDNQFWIVWGNWKSPASPLPAIPALVGDGRGLFYAAFGRETSKFYHDDEVLFETPSIREWSWRLPGAVSADGKVMATDVRNLKSGKSGIAINGKIGDLYSGTVSPPVLSRDGRVCAFVAEADEGYRVVVNGNPGAVYDWVTQPAVSSDGTVVAYAADSEKQWFLVTGEKKSKVPGPVGGVFLGVGEKTLGYWRAYGKGPDARQRIVVDGREGQEFAQVFEPKFSPDGKHVAYSARTPDDTWRIMVDERSYIVKDLRWGPVFLSEGKEVGFGYRQGRELLRKILDVK